MGYHVTQEVEVTVQFDEISDATVAQTEALRKVDRELSILEDDPRVYNYDVLYARIDPGPRTQLDPYEVHVFFTVTVSVHPEPTTQGTALHEVASDEGLETIDSVLEGLFDQQSPIGDPAVQKAL